MNISEKLRGGAALTAVALASVTVSGTAVALASGSLSGTSYQGCLQRSSHAIYRVQVNHQGRLRCPAHERPIVWNQRGPQGIPGPQGATGATGPKGDPGVSVTSKQLGAGGTACPTGGSSFTSASGTTYACNGATGAPGAQGPAGTFGKVTVRTISNTISGYSEVSDEASCLPGEVAVGGGESLGAGNGSGQGGLAVQTSRPDPVSGTPTAWYAILENSNASSVPYEVYVVCAAT